LGARAGADEAERARQLSDEGLVHFNQGRWREAVAAFEASYAVRPLAVLRFDIAQAHRLGGDCARARDEYRRYLVEAPGAPNRALVEGFIGEMERCAPPPPVEPPPPVAVAPPPVEPPPPVAAPRIAPAPAAA